MSIRIFRVVWAYSHGHYLQTWRRPVKPEIVSSYCMPKRRVKPQPQPCASNSIAFKRAISSALNELLLELMYVVDACTVNAFRARLDKFWKHQSVKFDFTADLTGTGNRSEEVIK